MRFLIVLSSLLLLSGCFKSISLSDVSTGVAAVGTSAIVDSVAPGLGTTAKVVVTTLGAVGGAAIVEDTVQTVTQETLKEVTNPWQGMVLAFQALLNHAFELVIAIGIAIVGIPMIFSFVIGKIMPRSKEKEVTQENELLKKIMKEKL